MITIELMKLYKTKRKNLWTIYYILLIAILLISLSACNNEDELQVSTLQVSLIDAPADYDSVIIDIQDVQINMNSENEGWQSLNEFTSGQYNLLELVNGNKAFLGETIVPAGLLSQVRLILGTENKLYTNTQSHDLATPSGQQSGLKIKVDATIVQGVSHELILDFDAGQSIIEAGNSDKYILRPVIHGQMKTLAGEISGSIQPESAIEKSIIYAVKSYDTISTYPDSEGNFSFPALEGGKYDVIGLSDTLSIKIEDVTVSTGRVTELDPMIFTY